MRLRRPPARPQRPAHFSHPALPLLTRPPFLHAECPAPKGNLCSGLGICGWDQSLSQARCFCDDGYISADCSKPASPIPGGAIAGAFFGGLILAACSLLGYGFYLFRAKQGAVGAAGAEGFYATVG